MSPTRTVAHPTLSDRVDRGRRARAAVPRSSHGDWSPAPDRPDPVQVLLDQARDRVPDLIPIRHERMLASPFAFYRGAAAIMAADLAPTPVTGIRVQCCGDAHLANFGGFAAPDRRMVFDLNDFDETLPGPWEWDVKRLAASFEIAARARGFDDDVRAWVVRTASRSYREAMREYAATNNLAVWYMRLDESYAMDHWFDRVSPSAIKRFQRNMEKAKRKDSLGAFAKLTHDVDGQVRIISDPPLIIPLDDMGPGAEGVRERLHEWFRGYRQSLRPDVRHLLESYELVDIARKVVGVGSVGTRTWIALLLGRDGADPLFLQMKEAVPSVLEQYLGRTRYSHHGRRVVEGQRLMQAASDIFLGWERAVGIDDRPHDFYVRQLWDGKISAAIDSMDEEVLGVYAEMCGMTLARAHARSGDRVAIASYLGQGQTFDRAMAEFAAAYADQNDLDFAAVTAAAAAGTIEVAGHEGAA